MLVRIMVAMTAFVLFSIPASAGAQWPPCAAGKLLVGECFAVHGRMTSCTSVPSVRIRIVGTRRVLGVADANGDVAGDEVLAGKLAREMITLPPCSKAAWGDFTVCPLTPGRPGVMQRVCLVDSSKLNFKEW